jgi:hypothetical protein
MRAGGAEFRRSAQNENRDSAIAKRRNRTSNSVKALWEANTPRCVNGDRRRFEEKVKEPGSLQSVRGGLSGDCTHGRGRVRGLSTRGKRNYEFVSGEAKGLGKVGRDRLKLQV